MGHIIDMQKHPPQAWHDLLPSNSDRKRYAVGEVLFHEGDASDGLYLLLSGQLKVYASNANGREHVYNVLGPDELLGELSLDGGPRSASVKAMTEVECLVMKNSAAHSMMGLHPEFAAQLFMKAASRARDSTRMRRSIALDTVPERVVALLEAAAVSDGNVRRIPSAMIQQEIANRIGASREMVHKVIGDLVRRKFIHKDAKHRMTIIKPLPVKRK